MYEGKMQAHLSLLRKLGLDLMLSGHLHYYERSEPMCENRNIKMEGGVGDVGS